MRVAPILSLGLSFLLGCVSQTVEPDLATEVQYLTPVARQELDRTREWLAAHELRVLADEIEIIVPDDLYEISTFFVKPDFFEETRRREVVPRDGKPCPIMVTEVVATTQAIQVSRFTLRGSEEVGVSERGLDLAVLRRLRVVADPTVSHVTIHAKGNVSWKLDEESSRASSKTFQIPTGAVVGMPIP